MGKLLFGILAGLGIGLGLVGAVLLILGRPPTADPPIAARSTPTPFTPTGVSTPTARPTIDPASGRSSTDPTPFTNGTPLAAPAGTMPVIVDLDRGKSVPFILRGGTRRTVTLDDTRLVFASAGVTVWATATITVSGDGVSSETAEIPAAYFRGPTVLNGVRVYVAITREFNDGALRDGGGTVKAARLVLSDSRYTMTDLTSYRWPFPNLLWEQGSHVTYPVGLQIGDNGLYHHRGMDIGMPKDTRITAWTTGILNGLNRGYDNTAWLTNTADGRSERGQHQVLHLDQVEWQSVGQRVLPGDVVGLSGGSMDMDGKIRFWHTHVAGDFEWGPMLGEWYTAHASPVALSYIKDWLVAGPFDNPDGATRLTRDYLGGEAWAQPIADAPAGSTTWKLWDNVVPGVVDVAESVDPYPFSGWAWVNGNYPTAAAYLATYVYAEEPWSVVLQVGSSDAIRIWMDQQEVFTQLAFVDSGDGGGPTMVPDQYAVPVDLHPGWNRLLIKVSQRGSSPKAWQLSVRVSDGDGDPIPDLRINPQMDPDAETRLLAPPLGTEPPSPEAPPPPPGPVAIILPPTPTPTPAVEEPAAPVVPPPASDATTAGPGPGDGQSIDSSPTPEPSLPADAPSDPASAADGAPPESPS